jgi:hypothetical protein
MFFKELKVAKWQQFETISVEFHDRLTILTGPNGSGKTTLLSLLARHGDYGWQYHSLATPKQDKSGLVRWMSRLFNGEDISNENVIGELAYTSGNRTALTVPTSGAPQYQINIQTQQPIKSLFIPSHRPVFRYQQVAQIPAIKKGKQAALSEVVSSSRYQYSGGGGQSHSWFMKNTLLGWAILGYGVSRNGKSIMPSDIEQIQFYEGFQDTLRKILPKSLGFEEFEIRDMEIVFVCNDGRDEFLLETASGGVSTLIDLAWQIYMYSTKGNTDFTVLIDEAENHLHPSMQRAVLGDFLDAFPGIRFIVSTHSPLIVGSVKDSAVYVLRYNENGKIYSQRLDLTDKAKSATEVLDEVLGVSATMPIWAETDLTRIVNDFGTRPVDKASFERLRKELTEAGLDRLVPEAITRLLKENDKTP